jgi:hypothetical protein
VCCSHEALCVGRWANAGAGAGGGGGSSSSNSRRGCPGTQAHSLRRHPAVLCGAGQMLQVLRGGHRARVLQVGKRAVSRQAQRQLHCPPPGAACRQPSSSAAARRSQSSLTAQGALMPTPLSACFSFCSTPPFDIAAAGLLAAAGLGPWCTRPAEAPARSATAAAASRAPCAKGWSGG